VPGAEKRALNVYEGVVMSRRRGRYFPRSIGAKWGSTEGVRCSTLIIDRNINGVSF